jgi:hypothetical protein
MKASLVLLPVLVLASFVTAKADITSSFPIGGNRGSTFDLEVRGEGLERAYAAWFDCEELKASVEKVEKIDAAEELPSESPPPDKPKRPVYKVLLSVKLSSAARVGLHKFRLISSEGVSNAWGLQVNGDPVIHETEAAHSTPVQAQPANFPAVINGRISQPGEVDYYSLAVSAGEDLVFEAKGTRLDPVVSVLEPIESWFGPDVKELAFNDDGDGRTAMARLNYRFSTAGRYLIAIHDFLSQGGPEFGYQLRIVPASNSTSSEHKQNSLKALAHLDQDDWQEHNFGREIKTDRLKTMQARTAPVSKPGKAPADPAAAVGPQTLKTAAEKEKSGADLTVSQEVPIRVREQDPKDKTSRADEITLPAIIEGTIEHPGDTDVFRFKARKGEQVAFEIQTADEAPPQFNPHVIVRNGEGNEILANVYKFVGGACETWNQLIEPKMIYTFPNEGEVQLAVSDITLRYGNSHFVYRILVRPQIPHVGDIDIKEDRINLTPGEAKKLTITANQEEGFDGQIAVMVDDLPAGVQVVAAAEVEPDRGPSFAKLHPERFLPKSQKITLVMIASEDAPITALPRFVNVKARPIVNGKLGTLFPVRTIPVMVVKPKTGAGGKS